MSAIKTLFTAKQIVRRHNEQRTQMIKDKAKQLGMSLDIKNDLFTFTRNGQKEVVYGIWASECFIRGAELIANNFDFEQVKAVPSGAWKEADVDTSWDW